LAEQVQAGTYRSLYSLLTPGDERIHIYFIRSLSGTNGIALSPSIALVADITTVNAFRATAHEIGHLLGLSHTSDSRTRLLYRGVNGIILNEWEIGIARLNAQKIAN